MMFCALSKAKGMIKYMKIAIITGASSGMGREFAIQLDQMKHHFDEFWLIARRESNLVELQNVLKTKSRCIPLDLVPIENSQVLADLLAQEKPEIGRAHV